MATTFDTAPVQRADRTIIAGRILSGLVILFLAADAIGKLVAPATMIAYSPPLGLPADPGLYRLLGAMLLACTALYAWPRTAFVGAVLLTGYLGGAIAVNVRAEMPLISNTLFGAYLGLFVWAGLYLRSARLRAVIHGA